MTGVYSYGYMSDIFPDDHYQNHPMEGSGFRDIGLSELQGDGNVYGEFIHPSKLHRDQEKREEAMNAANWNRARERREKKALEDKLKKELSSIEDQMFEEEARWAKEKAELKHNIGGTENIYSVRKQKPPAPTPITAPTDCPNCDSPQWYLMPSEKAGETYEKCMCGHIGRTFINRRIK
jgi:hypothetical protein